MSTNTLAARFVVEGVEAGAISVNALQIRERLGAPHTIDLDLLSLEPFDGRVIVGAPCALSVVADREGELRRYSGFVSQVVDRLDSEADYFRYSLRMSPRACMFDLVRLQEIFVDTSVPDVIRAKLALAQLIEGEDFDLRLSSTYSQREFIVQYGESDLAFLQRLCEHIGITMFIEQRDGRDAIVFTDHNDGFPRDDRPLVCRARGEKTDVYELALESVAIPAMYAVADYNYQIPHVDVNASCNIDGGMVGGVVEYHAHARDPGEAEELARVRAEESLVHQHVFTLKCDLPFPGAGKVLTLTNHPRLGDLPLLVIEASHEARFQNVGGGAVESQYECSLRAVPVDVPFRPRRSTPRPRIHGLVCGIVENAPNIDSELPFIDERGRYLVRMLFDTAPPGERKASLPIRMIQPHSGPNYGIHFPLRPGTEVMIAFINGDPDRPVIVGSVPNTLTPTPVNRDVAHLHRIKTKSGVLVEIDDDG